MTNDHELLKLAAKALDNPKIRWNGAIWCNCERMNEPDARGNRYPGEWNPLTDDGDALRLAVKLELQASFYNNGTVIDPEQFSRTEVWGQDGALAARRAIVRAAAEIGKVKV